MSNLPPLPSEESQVETDPEGTESTPHKRWYKNWKVWACVLIFFAIVGMFNSGSKEDVIADNMIDTTEPNFKDTDQDKVEEIPLDESEEIYEEDLNTIQDEPEETVTESEEELVIEQSDLYNLMGDTITINNVSYKLNFARRLSNGEGMKDFLVCSVEVTNNSNSAIQVRAADFELEADHSDPIQYFFRDGLSTFPISAEMLEPGQSISGAVVFLVPTFTDFFELEILHDSEPVAKFTFLDDDVIRE